MKAAHPSRLYPRFLSAAALLLVAGLLCGHPDAARAETTGASGATAINSIPANGLQITGPGTYYLAADLSINADLAYAISITAPNVTLDFNGHTLSQLYTSDNGTLGVYVNAPNVTVRNGTLTGFLTGVNGYGNGIHLEDLFVVATTWRGVDLGGSDMFVRRCRISNLGGETVPNLAPWVLGIVISSGANNRVVDCDVTTLNPGQGGYSYSILLAYTANALVVNNRMTASNGGLGTFGSSGKYRDNLVIANFYAPYSVDDPSRMIDAGNNQ